MKHIISLSGGVGSYFTLERVLKENNDRPYGILKRKGKPYTLKQLRQSIESKDKAKQLSIDEICDIGGCGCFIEEE